MKILIATDNYYPNVNGASYSAQRFAHYLSRAGHEVIVIAPSRYPWDEEFEYEGVMIYGLKSMNLERIKIARPLSGVRWKIYSIFQEFHPDIVHIYSHFAISRKTASVAREVGIPVVGTNHFMPENFLALLRAPRFVKRFIRWLLWGNFLQVFSKLDGVTSPTRTAADILLAVGLAKPVKVITNGVDLEKFKPTNHGEYLKQRFRLPDKPILLYVGRLDREKNLDFVLRCLPEALTVCDFHFVITGNGAEKNALFDLAETLELADRVTFTGFIADSDLPNLYALATCFIMPGTVELQSMVTLEAMATGLPIIAANAVALPELVENGKNGYLYRSGSHRELVLRLTAFFGDESRWPDFGRRSQEIVSNHDIQKAVSDFEAFYGNYVKQNEKDRQKTAGLPPAAGVRPGPPSGPHYAGPPTSGGV